MLVNQSNNGIWFAPKRFGYGAGLPIAWQGWALLLSYTAVMFGLTWLADAAALGTKVVAIMGLMFSTMLFVEVARRHTAGGWKWHWGSRD